MLQRKKINPKYVSVHTKRVGGAQRISEFVCHGARPSGKDSQVMVRLAQKAFHPGKLPFSLLHVDTTWKFREMYAFRDRFVSEAGDDTTNDCQSSASPCRRPPSASA